MDTYQIDPHLLVEIQCLGNGAVVHKLLNQYCHLKCMISNYDEDHDEERLNRITQLETEIRATINKLKLQRDGII